MIAQTLTPIWQLGKFALGNELQTVGPAPFLEQHSNVEPAGGEAGESAPFVCHELLSMGGGRVMAFSLYPFLSMSVRRSVPSGYGRKLALPLVGCRSWETKPCTSPKKHRRAGLGEGTWVSQPQRQ